jgi:hypothetical protein
MPSYLVVDISVNDWEPFREYLRLAPPIEKATGALSASAWPSSHPPSTSRTTSAPLPMPPRGNCVRARA